jgi:uncharacterized membrane protein YphA (DoxX/SURF4 family)
MTTALWIAQIVLAAAFAAAGTMKLTRPLPALADMGMTYVEDQTDQMVRLTGAVELLGALGLILPAATGIATVLTPLAAAGLVVVMLVAAGVHVRRDELDRVPVNVVLGGIALFIAWGRFGSYSF